MNINGKEIGFAFTVGAAKELAMLCPDGDISRLGEASGKTFVERLAFTEDLILILNRAHCAIQTIKGETGASVTREELDCLPPKELMEIGTEAMAAVQSDSRQEIELDGKKDQGVE